MSLAAQRLEGLLGGKVPLVLSLQRQQFSFLKPGQRRSLTLKVPEFSERSIKLLHLLLERRQLVAHLLDLRSDISVDRFDLGGVPDSVEQSDPRLCLIGYGFDLMPAENRDWERQIISTRQLLSLALIIDYCDAITRIGSARY